jgi:GNAT superfamily N-acetyltransferase
MHPGTWRVGPVAAELTQPLRHRVLRSHVTGTVHWDDDEHTVAFAARTVDGEVIGTAVVRPEACPWRPDRPDAWRLRGMATEESTRGAGIGAAVLSAVIDRVSTHGGGLLWCNARTPALRFYERAGFTTHGEEWHDPDIGPHIQMWRDVAARDPAASAEGGSEVGE